MTELESGAYICFRKVIDNLIHFHCENIHLSRFILRELSLDTQMVREMMSIYSAKERYYFTKIIEMGIARQEFMKINVNLLYYSVKITSIYAVLK